jgi:3-hydroxy-9,10-secoandrosta-1,3,5(10)-triene-9,17-dione monooxygenase reductase component
VKEYADPKDSTAFRRVLGRFPTGLAIVATEVDKKPYGLTCQSFTSVSLDPPLISIFLTKNTGSLWAIDQTVKFTVSILNEHQSSLARVFAIPGANKFKDVSLLRSPSDLPIIDESLAWIECDVHTRFDAGDHIGILGLATSMGCIRDTKPLVYWRGGYGRFV